MRERLATLGPLAAVAGILGLCCGLPVLLSLGMLGAVAGISLQSWALLALGLVVAVVGWTNWARRAPIQHIDPELTTDNSITRGGNHP